ncbi:MAG: helix-turn-helix domain-containing protein [Planctomycetota bacterium]|nr:helix-turn-helix domain-containing protein [Planctomycetota bacterium]
MSALAELLSSQVKAEMCRILFGSQPEELHLRELTRRSGHSFSTVQRELAKLSRQGIVERRHDGNRTYFRANKEHPFYAEIRSLVRKSSGLREALREVLSEDRRIQIAFVFGSVAAQNEKPGSDVDLMVVGGTTLKEVVSRLFALAESLGREINPHVFSAAEFSKRIRSKDHFLTTVMKEPKLFVVGSEDELTRLA